MSLNGLLIWTVAISCLVTILNLFRFRLANVFRSLPAMIVLMVLVVTYFRYPEKAGLYAGAVWGILILAPGIASRLSNSFLSSRRFVSAYCSSWIALVLHPFDGARDQPKFVKALWLLDQKQDQQAEELLQQLTRKNNSVGKTAMVILTRLRGNWQGFLNIIQNAPVPGRLLADPLLANIYLQALGETGQTELLVQGYRHGMLKKRRGTSALMLNIARMKLAAFCGRVDFVAMLLDGPLGHFEQATQKFWLATAMQASGRMDAANSLFESLLDSEDRQIAIASRQRMLNPVRVVIQPPTGVSELLNEMASAVEHESQYALISSSNSRFSYATWGFVGVLVVVFFLEMINGGVGRAVWEADSLSIQRKAMILLANASNDENLLNMGALVLPTELFPNPTRRIISAAFLHFGLLHLLMNVGGLLIFGQRVEDAWGPWLMGVSYLICAIISIYLMTVLPLGATPENPYVLVGASGGVMGLIGCLLGYLGWGQLLKKNALVSREFRLLFSIVMIQMVFDQFTPNVSSECHIMGLLLGVGCGLVVGVIKNGFPGKQQKSPSVVSGEPVVVLDIDEGLSETM